MTFLDSLRLDMREAEDEAEGECSDHAGVEGREGLTQASLGETLYRIFRVTSPAWTDYTLGALLTTYNHPPLSSRSLVQYTTISRDGTNQKFC